jgi:hypothetical protein
MTKLKELLESKAFITAVLAAIAAAGGIYGFNVPVATVMVILTPIMVAIGAQGWTDAIVVKAKLEHAHDLKMQEVYDAQEARRVQKGSVGTRMLMGLGLFASTVVASIMLFTATQGCAKVQPVVTDVIDCAEAESSLVAQGYSVLEVFADVVAVIESGPSGAVAAVEALIEKYGSEIVACAIDNYPESGSGSGSDVAPTVVLKHQLLEQYFSGKTVVHSYKRH